MPEAAAHALGALALAASLGWLLPGLWFLARFRAPALPEEGRVTLLLCATGRNPNLPALFAALAAQTLRPRRLVVAVESEADPAFAQVAELAPALPFPVETVIAGTAPHRSRKATGLIAAARRVDEEDQAVVLLDADILPPPEWLSWLASPAIRGSWDIVSGYRWQLAGAGGPARQLVTWLDRGFAVGPRQMLFREVWGGSTAISAAAFARLDLPATLERTLSTDGAISRRASALGLRMLMRRAVLLPTPAEGGEREALGFQRRQIQLYRVYAPGS
ncbi:MAG: glycosyltransferase [Acetobacteraceae bacterium]|nr:glycosyltransferase [Acetobacteraceae bacterium]MDW8398625.1 glycosyltransferase [Acetobacteraceae bacterium]